MRQTLTWTTVIALVVVMTGCPKKDPVTPSFDADPGEDTSADVVDDSTGPDEDVSPDAVLPDVGPDDTPDADVATPDIAVDADEVYVDVPPDIEEDAEVFEPECITDPQCNDFDGCCTEGVCNEGKCEAQPLEGCCEQSDDCDDGDTTTSDLCLDSCEENGCAHYVADLCPGAPLYSTKNFDNASLQLLKDLDSNTTDNVQIRVVKSTSVSPGWSAYIGDKDCGHYYNGPLEEDCTPVDSTFGESTPMELALTWGAPVALEAEAPAYVGFWINMAAEPSQTVDLGDGPQVFRFDYLAAYIDDGETVEEVWASTDAAALGDANTTGGDWEFHLADLSAWAGKDVVVSFSFVTDAQNNYDGGNWFGVYLDEIGLQGSCGEAQCDPGGDPCPDDGSACTENACTEIGTSGDGFCAYQTASVGEPCSSCAQPTDCGTDECHTYECNSGLCSAELLDSCCSPSSTFPQTTSAPVVAFESFEDEDISDWTVVDEYDDDEVTWRVDGAGPAFAGAISLYFGNFDGTYVSDSGDPAAATIWTPFFEVDTDLDRHQVASFWLWMSTEYDSVQDPGDPEDLFDTLTVWVQAFGDDDDDSVLVWSSAEALGNTTRGQYMQIGASLEDYRGETVRIAFSFDSVDTNGNDFGGVRIDDMTVSSVCGNECVGFSDCSDSDVCTPDYCDLGFCVNDDALEGCCETDTDCNDDNECTVDTCIEGLCSLGYDDTKLNVCCSQGPWPTEYFASFEDGSTDGFAAETDTPPVVWSVITGLATDGESSYNFADPATSTYETPGGEASGRLVSAEVDVPPTTQGVPFAEFSYWLETEWDVSSANDFEPLIVVDELRVLVATAGDVGSAPVEWTSHYLGNTTRGAWESARVDLSDYRGESVQLVFEFETGAGGQDAYSGPFVDSVTFGKTCLGAGAIQCIEGADCSPADECKWARCDAEFKCEQIQKDTPECCIPTVADEISDTFEADGDLAWTFESCDPSGGVEADPTSMWMLSDSGGAAGIPAKEGDQLLYFGNGTNYGDTLGSCGIATSPVLSLDNGVPWSMELWTYLGIESHAGCPDGADFSDTFDVYVIDQLTTEETLILSKEGIQWPEFKESQCSDYSKWIEREIDLSEWAGRDIVIEIMFDSVDDFENSGKGIGLDHMRLVKGCDDF